MSNLRQSFTFFYDNFTSVTKKSRTNRISAIDNISSEAVNEGVIRRGLLEMDCIEEFIEAFENITKWERYKEKITRKDGGTGTDLGTGMADLCRFYIYHFGIEDSIGNTYIPGYKKIDERIKIASKEFVEPTNQIEKGTSDEEIDNKKSDDRVLIGPKGNDFFEVDYVTDQEIKDKNIPSEKYFDLFINRSKLIRYMVLVCPVFTNPIFNKIDENDWNCLFGEVLTYPEDKFAERCYIKEDGQSKNYIYFPNSKNNIFGIKGKILFESLINLHFEKYVSDDGKDKKYFLTFAPNMENGLFEKYIISMDKNNINRSVCNFAKVDFNKKADFFIGLDYADDIKESIKIQIETALQTGKHLLLIGPPGTGKSTLAKNIAKTYVNSNFNFHTAHSEWSVFDTIGGYRMNEKGHLELSEGVLLKCFRDESKICNKWLVIDEINRSDINKSFGEFFSILAGDSVSDIGLRNSESELVKLIQERDVETNIEGYKYVKRNEYVIPEDWRMIGTMNTADKSSLYDISLAFLRRFAIIYVGVNILDRPMLTNLLKIWGLGARGTYLNKGENKDKLVNIINNINSNLKTNSIGPALIKSFAEGISNIESQNGKYEDKFFASLITMYFLPQLDGCGKQDANTIYSELIGVVKDTNDQMKRFIEDYLGYRLNV